MIVTGAVDIATDAVQQLRGRGLEMEPSERARLVTNLLTVVCGDANAQPTLDMSR